MSISHEVWGAIDEPHAPRGDDQDACDETSSERGDFCFCQCMTSDWGFEMTPGQRVAGDSGRRGRRLTHLTCRKELAARKISGSLAGANVKFMFQLVSPTMGMPVVERLRKLSTRSDSSPCKSRLDYKIYPCVRYKAT